MFGDRAFRLGSLFGIRIGVDPSWFLVFVFITYSIAGGFAKEHEAWSAIGVWGAAITASLMFFGSILLHELGHSVTSILLDVPVRSITLFLFGGAAELGAEPKRPRDEFLIAIAGPATSFLLSGIFGLVWVAVESTSPVGVVVGWLAIVNLGVAVFNMLPGFPLDGGRVLRSILWRLLGSLERATQWAGRVGIFVGSLFIAVGAAIVVSTGNWLYGVFLGFMGWFLTRAARENVVRAVYAERLRAVKVGAVMARDLPTIDGWSTLEDATTGPFSGRATSAAFVEEDGALVGVLTVARIAAVPQAKFAYHQVRQEMIPLAELAPVAPEVSLFVALKAMERESGSVLLVRRGEELLGVLTREDLGRVLRA